MGNAIFSYNPMKKMSTIYLLIDMVNIIPLGGLKHHPESPVSLILVTWLAQLVS